MDYSKIIMIDPGKRSGKACVRDTRITVYDVLDYLAAGIDPERAVIFTHSQIAELNQLVLPFLSLVTVSELRRNPTVKDEIAAGGGTTSALMFTYPVHQAADILFCHANLVPVGRDQLPHVELARTIARRFNDRYSPEQRYFPEPEALMGTALGRAGRVHISADDDGGVWVAGGTVTCVSGTVEI